MNAKTLNLFGLTRIECDYIGVCCFTGGFSTRRVGVSSLGNTNGDMMVTVLTIRLYGGILLYSG